MLACTPPPPLSLSTSLHVLRTQLAYNFSELIEAHAVDTYGGCACMQAFMRSNSGGLLTRCLPLLQSSLLPAVPMPLCPYVPVMRPFA